MNGRLHHSSFKAMGTACAVSVTAGERRPPVRARQALVAASTEVEACEHALSRFDSASDLSRLNAASGEWVEIDRRLERALRAALRLRAETAGRFDPTILPALVAAGYDRSFEQLAERPARIAAGWQAGAEIELTPGRARIERGAAVDLGGIGKGFSAGCTLTAMRGGLARDARRDRRSRRRHRRLGLSPERGPWRIAIADPRSDGTTLGVLQLEQGGVATSGRNARRFGPAGSLHHLIDPDTGAPASRGPLAVTVVAPIPPRPRDMRPRSASRASRRP